jgi:peptidoglycan/xylan/chitin deacetylase (PgdA/CDA1 family)
VKALFFLLLDLLGLNALFRRLNRGKIKVLLYHNITPGGSGFDFAISPEEFDSHLRYLKSRYHMLGIDQSGAWRSCRSDRVNILITFDDGFLNNLEFAAPILARHGISAAFFLIADCIETGAPPHFTEKYGKGGGDRAAYRTVDTQGAMALIRYGMTIGSHSLAHRDFSGLDDREAEADAKAARQKLERLLGCEVALFAFPWGKHRRDQARRMSFIYERVFLTEHGFAGEFESILPRNEVSGSAHLRAAASGALDFVRRWAVRS